MRLAAAVALDAATNVTDWFTTTFDPTVMMESDATAADINATRVALITTLDVDVISNEPKAKRTPAAVAVLVLLNPTAPRLTP
jgi:hypothetical protein